MVPTPDGSGTRPVTASVVVLDIWKRGVRMDLGDVRPTALVKPPRPQEATRGLGWSAGRTAALVIGSLLVLVSLALLGAGGTGLWADGTQREAGYATTGVHNFSTSAPALATGRPTSARPGRNGYTPRACSARCGSGSRRRAPAPRCSLGSAAPLTLIATSPA